VLDLIRLIITREESVLLLIVVIVIYHIKYRYIPHNIFYIINKIEKRVVVVSLSLFCAAVCVSSSSAPPCVVYVCIPYTIIVYIYTILNYRPSWHNCY
jgi:hypothetical protein